MQTRIERIERNMVDVRNLFIRFFNALVKGVKSDPGGFGIHEVSISHMKALAAFHEDREYSMTELSNNALVKMPSMTETVDRLEAAGVLERLRNERDRRVVQVRLTEKGKKLHAELMDRRRRELCDLFSTLDEKDQDELLTSLGRVATILKKVMQ